MKSEYNIRVDPPPAPRFVTSYGPNLYQTACLLCQVTAQTIEPCRDTHAGSLNSWGMRQTASFLHALVYPVDCALPT